MNEYCRDRRPSASLRIQALEEQGLQRDCESVGLFARLSLGRADITGLEVAIDVIRTDSSKMKAVPGAAPNPALASSPGRLNAPPSRVFSSLIRSDFPPLLAAFRRKHFTLLLRGSRDGFGVGPFHGRCNGHANRLALILGRGGNIFGGFTPVKRESLPGEGC
jgi:hypothetical protein